MSDIPSWIEYFKEITFTVAKKSTCLRRKVGAIAVKDRRILATGYNGQIAGSPHCKTCMREDLKIPSGMSLETCRSVHAEQNLVGQAAKYGIAINGATAIVTNKPCITCYKILCNSGIKNIIFFESYPDITTDTLIKFNNSKIYAYKDYFLIAKIEDMLFKEVNTPLF